MRLVLLACLAAVPAHGFPLGAGSGAASLSGTRELWLPMIQHEAAVRGLPAALADAVAMVETGYNPGAVGSSGEIGLMQVMPATARQLGFTGSTGELFQPATNIRLGVAYLARAWSMAGGNVCRALTKYRAGLGEEVSSPLSITYCARAMGWLDATGSALAQGVAAGGTDARTAEAAAPPVADPHVIAMFPPLPEQAGLTATPRLPAVITPAAYFAAPVAVQLAAPVAARVQAAATTRSLAGRTRASHARRSTSVDKTAAAVEAALSEY